MHLRPLIAGSCIFLLSLPSFGYSRSRRSPTSPRGVSRRASKQAGRLAGQRSIDATRATQIQTALGNAGYLQGAPTGHWDNATESAMQRFQADNGWQTKSTPDARAIIKLGLGPQTLHSADMSREAGTNSSVNVSADQR